MELVTEIELIAQRLYKATCLESYISIQTHEKQIGYT